MRATVTIDARNWRAATDRLARVLPDAMREQVLREEAKQFAQTVTRILPPKTYAQGRAAVAGDIDRAVWAPKPNDPKIRSDRLKQIMQQGDTNALRAYLGNTGRKGWNVTGFHPMLHTQARNRRGRVPRERRVASVQWQRVDTYKRTIQGRVGILKASNNATTLALGGRLQSWFGKHGTRFSDHTEIRGANPSITMTSSGSKAGSAQRFEEIYRYTLASRQRSIITKMNRIMTGKATNLGFASFLG